MTLTLTIDTHPHSNALIEGQVKEAVEAVLRARRLGVVVEMNPGEDVDALKEDIERNAQEVDRLRGACASSTELLRKAEALTEEGTDLYPLIQNAIQALGE